VLNGSGKRGAAGELAKYLEGLGYSVSITGNTNLQTGSKLRLKSGSEIYRDILTADLESRFEAASGSGLPQTDVVGAEVIIGAD
ncbi:MAG: LytR C-terminal domain-containing protein, partial [Candidatus Magasanikbacteria bacterium]|nr:LytR C-terminal domain-containing protein [Candidatus Magasanikbacteria bacterium]